MKKSFKNFAENIRLTESQEKDAKIKYTNVCKKLHDHYYDSSYDGNSKLLFGSYKTKTNTRPFSSDQDVDVLFKIPEESYLKFKNYNGNGPSALLQEIRSILKEKYVTTDKISSWGKVVLVKFKEETHNVEVLPAFEKEDGTFVIPNSENGGLWDSFDPRSSIKDFQKSNADTTQLTADLTRIFKTWVKNTNSLSYKSYKLSNDIIKFLNYKYTNGADYSDYNFVIRDCFIYLKEIADDSTLSFIDTALARAKKAISYIQEDKLRKASEEYRKIFGNIFPMCEDLKPEKCEQTRTFSNPSKPYANVFE